MAAACFVGIDVAKDHLDVAVRPTGQEWRASNTASGIAPLVSRLRDLAPTLIVVEATGGLERAVTWALVGAALPVAICNPRQVHDFAKATGRLAKTDHLDARVLAHFADVMRPPIHAVPAAEAQLLSATLARRSQILEMLTAEDHRLSSAVAEMQPRIQAHLTWLAQELAELDQDLDQRIQTDPVWHAKDQRLRSVPGVGRVLATTLVADLPELGTLDRHQIASLAGVAPLNCDSGQRRGKRAIWGGRARVRAKLYMATLAATRWNVTIKSFYERLRGAGKPAKVALTACMRKLLTILNAILRDNKTWEAPLPQTA